VLLDTIRGSLEFIPFPDSTKGLLAASWAHGNFMSDLYVYDMATQDRYPITSAQGAFAGFGYSPDLSKYWYHIWDFCDTRLVFNDGRRIPTIQSSDRILGWVDDELFLVETTMLNPPECTASGIALANRYGLTGDWITTSSSKDLLLSPDGKQLLYSTDCTREGCKQAMLVNVDGSSPRILLENNPAFGASFSPDSGYVVYPADCIDTGCKKLSVVSVDGTYRQDLFEFEDYRSFTLSWLQD
ncbi:MAG: TolB family protein, partial [Anaerolineales bacterium]